MSDATRLEGPALIYVKELEGERETYQVHETRDDEIVRIIYCGKTYELRNRRTIAGQLELVCVS